MSLLNLNDNSNQAMQDKTAPQFSLIAIVERNRYAEFFLPLLK
jgi:hypothetical protein